MSLLNSALPGAVKDEKASHPVAALWRPALCEIVRAFVEGDYHVARAIPGVDPVSPETAEHIKANVAAYGTTLVGLPDETWKTSVAQWMGDGWEVLVDLWTKEEGRSDLVLHLFVSETDDAVRFSVHLV
jgi:hypothetical protein